VSGAWVPVKAIHIDHDPIDFVEIADDFIEAFEEAYGGIQADDLMRTHANDEWHMRFKDKAVDAAWIAYHQERAQLRAVRYKINLAKPKTISRFK